MGMFQNLTGFRDFYPDQCQLRNNLFNNWRRVSFTANFREYDVPSLESLDLYREKSGEEILSQIYHFMDKGGRAVAMRPEITPSVARMVGAKANALKKPIKWFSIGECFRYERPQKGRLRSFYQFNADIFGEESILADVELINLLINSLKIFGLTSVDFRVRLSDRIMWALLLELLGVDPNQTKDVLVLIDKYDRITDQDWELKTTQLFGAEKAMVFRSSLKEWLNLSNLADLKKFWQRYQLEDSLCKKVFQRLDEWSHLLEALKTMGVSDFIELDFTIVRGLAYYTGFVFEAFDRNQKSRALAGGGRYDHLVAKLGGPEIPATGFAVGDVTLQEFLKSKNLLPTFCQSLDVYVVVDGYEMLHNALSGISTLRSQGISVDYPLKPISLGKQFKIAHSSGANWIVVYGEREWGMGEVTLKDLSNGMESVVSPRVALESIVSKHT